MTSDELYAECLADIEKKYKERLREFWPRAKEVVERYGPNFVSDIEEIFDLSLKKKRFPEVLAELESYFANEIKGKFDIVSPGFRRSDAGIALRTHFCVCIYNGMLGQKLKIKA